MHSPSHIFHKTNHHQPVDYADAASLTLCSTNDVIAELLVDKLEVKLMESDELQPGIGAVPL